MVVNLGAFVFLSLLSWESERGGDTDSLGILGTGPVHRDDEEEPGPLQRAHGRGAVARLGGGKARHQRVRVPGALWGAGLSASTTLSCHFGEHCCLNGCEAYIKYY